MRTEMTSSQMIRAAIVKSKKKIGLRIKYITAMPAEPTKRACATLKKRSVPTRQ